MPVEKITRIQELAVPGGVPGAVFFAEVLEVSARHHGIVTLGQVARICDQAINNRVLLSDYELYMATAAVHLGLACREEITLYFDPEDIKDDGLFGPSIGIVCRREESPEAHLQLARNFFRVAIESLDPASSDQQS